MFNDSSTNNFEVTAYGDTALSTAVKKYGNAAGYFDGDGDYIQIDTTSDPVVAKAFNFYNIDFTIECWIYSTTDQTGGAIISTRNAGVYSPWEIQIGFPNQNQLSLLINSGGSWYGNVFYGTTVIPQNEWIHIAWVCNGGYHTVYVNGVADPDLTNKNAPIVESAAQPDNIYIGEGGDGNFTGYIDDLRITKGIARYTSNFTPPNAELPDPSDPHGANVSLLLHMDGTNGSTAFTDHSQNNFTITAGGDAQISTAEKKFGTGSALFDGEEDYLELPLSSAFDFGSDNFTIECWFYTDNSNWQTILARWGGSQNAYFIGMEPNGIGFNIYINGSLVLGGGSVNLSAWNHIALVRNGTSLKLFLNGIEEDSYNIGYTAIDTTDAQLRIGADNDVNNKFNGYIDEVRITKGVARYTANFVPQTAPFANPEPLNFPIGALAFWKLDDLNDSSGNSYTLTNNGGVQFVAGKIGDCAQINNNYLSRSIAFDTSQDWSISLWFKRASFSGYPTIIDFGGGNPCLDLRYGDTINFNDGYSELINGPFTADVWTHVVLSSENGTVSMYINGVFVDSTSWTGNISSVARIATSIGDENRYLNGDIDAVGLWNRSLTEQEIAQLYNNGNGSEPV